MSGLDLGHLLAHGFVQRLPTLFAKADTSSVAFTSTGLAAVSLKAGTFIDVNGTLLRFDTDTAVTMPALTAGTDYAIYACTDGTVQADASFTAPAGYTTANSRKIGGFHFAPGGNAVANAGGNTTPQINPYSLWDLRFRPACTDPRGMALVAGGFWADIYLTGVDHVANGTSKFNVTITDGASPPKKPLAFGGDGTSAYTTCNWWDSAEVAAGYGKRLPTYSEFAELAFGTTEASSIGVDPGLTSWAAAYVSKWGCNQVSGVMWQWGDEFGGGASTATWAANTGGRGSTYQMENAVLLGGSWASGSLSGSRASLWNASPPSSYDNVGLRCVCDPCILY